MPGPTDFAKQSYRNSCSLTIAEYIGSTILPRKIRSRISARAPYIILHCYPLKRYILNRAGTSSPDSRWSQHGLSVCVVSCCSVFSAQAMTDLFTIRVGPVSCKWAYFTCLPPWTARIATVFRQLAMDSSIAGRLYRLLLRRDTQRPRIHGRRRSVERSAVYDI